MSRNSRTQPTQLVCSSLTFSYGPRTVLDDISLTLAPGDRIGVIGANGTGKSTLLRLLAGELEPEHGSVALHPPTASIGLLRQTLADDADETVATHLGRVTGMADVIADFDQAVQDLGSAAAGAEDRYDRALTRYVDTDAASFDERVAATLDEIGLHVELARFTRHLSGGQRARVGLAAIMLSAHDVLLLDEPTNDLDLDGLALLERFAIESPQPIAVVSHDRAFLAAVSTAILEIDDHHHTATRFNGGYDSWLTERERAKALHQEAYDGYLAKRSDLETRAQRQQQWSVQGAAAAKKDKSEGDKFVRAHRIATSEKQAGKAKQTQRALERLDRNESVEAPWKPWELRLTFDEAARPGQDVAVAHRAVVEVGTFALGPLDVAVTAGDRILLTGPNGSGKTTLLHLLLGQRALTSGTATLGPSVEVGVLGQDRPLFAEAASLTRAFGDAAGCDDETARSQLAKLGLDSARLERPVNSLSMGERTRAALGLFAAKGTNLLVVDEPTNHLDLPAIEALEAALAVYPHTLILVSHDRRLIEAVETTRQWRLQITGRDGQQRSELVEV